MIRFIDFHLRGDGVVSDVLCLPRGAWLRGGGIGIVSWGRGRAGTSRRGSRVLLFPIFIRLPLGLGAAIVGFVKTASFEDDSSAAAKEANQTRLAAAGAIGQGRRRKRLPLLKAMITRATGVFVSGHGNTRSFRTWNIDFRRSELLASHSSFAFHPLIHVYLEGCS